MAVYAVILCGGRGERFWPKSRRARPKQFIELFGRPSLTRDTSERVRRLCPKERQLFVAPEEFASVVRRQVSPAPGNLLLEPLGRNTAPAIGLAAAHLAQRAPGSTMVVLPADHLIVNRAEFLRCLRRAVQLAANGLLVTFGIVPARIDTGYGYIKLGQPISGGSESEPAAFAVDGFREKPDLVTAGRYVDSGEYLWNSGMFVWRTDAILEAMARHATELHDGLLNYARSIGTKSERKSRRRFYDRVESISIDYAVMERAENVAVVRATFDWDDVGSWLAVARHVPPDSSGNVAVGRFWGMDSSNCIIDTDSGLVATLGVTDLVIVRAGDAVLVAHRARLDDLKRLVAQLAASPVFASYL